MDSNKIGAFDIVSGSNFTSRYIFLILTRTFVFFSATYANADVRIEKTFLDDGATLLNAPRTKQSKPCGYSAERILLFPEFFIDTDQEISSEYGDKGKKKKNSRTNENWSCLLHI